jgi:hypothetical protein
VLKLHLVNNYKSIYKRAIFVQSLQSVFLEKKKKERKQKPNLKTFLKNCETNLVLHNRKEKFCLFDGFCNKGKRVKAAYVVLYFIT